MSKARDFNLEDRTLDLGLFPQISKSEIYALCLSSGHMNLLTFMGHGSEPHDSTIYQDTIESLIIIEHVTIEERRLSNL